MSSVIEAERPDQAQIILKTKRSHIQSAADNVHVYTVMLAVLEQGNHSRYKGIIHVCENEIFDQVNQTFGFMNYLFLYNFSKVFFTLGTFVMQDTFKRNL